MTPPTVYLIAHAIKGKAKEHQERLIQEVHERFGTRVQRIGPHLTFKAPFECEDIEPVKAMLTAFAKNHSAHPLKLDGFGHFDDKVVFIKAHLSDKAKKAYLDLIHALKKFSWLDWNETDGDSATFHATIASKKLKKKFPAIWDYLQDRQFKYDLSFDNVTLYSLGPDGWDVVQEYRLQSPQTNTY